jgi:hypothetical protein
LSYYIGLEQILPSLKEKGLHRDMICGGLEVTLRCIFHWHQPNRLDAQGIRIGLKSTIMDLGGIGDANTDHNFQEEKVMMGQGKTPTDQ